MNKAECYNGVAAPVCCSSARNPFGRWLLQVGAIVAMTLAPSICSAQKPLGESVQDLATELTAKVTKKAMRKIAVVSFQYWSDPPTFGPPTELDAHITEVLVSELRANHRLMIVEPTTLDKDLPELKRQHGVVVPDSAKQLGKVAGVDAIVAVSIDDVHRAYIAVICLLIDSQTGREFNNVQGQIYRDDNIDALLLRAASRQRR